MLQQHNRDLGAALPSKVGIVNTHADTDTHTQTQTQTHGETDIVAYQQEGRWCLQLHWRQSQTELGRRGPGQGLGLGVAVQCAQPRCWAELPAWQEQQPEQPEDALEAGQRLGLHPTAWLRSGCCCCLAPQPWSLWETRRLLQLQWELQGRRKRGDHEGAGAVAESSKQGTAQQSRAQLSTASRQSKREQSKASRHLMNYKQPMDGTVCTHK